jgi:multidrug efflux pump subunit AcrA (membrane-fusion protein)
VLAVNTTGSTNSSVTTYAVTIVLDPTELEIYSNMAVSANIITDIQSDVLLVPSTAIQSLNEQNIVQIMKDGVVSSVNVEIGTANDSETIITSGLSEGDVVVTATVNATQNKTKNTAATTSVFSGMSSGNTMRMTVIGGAGGPPPGGF